MVGLIRDMSKNQEYYMEVNVKKSHIWHELYYKESRLVLANETKPKLDPDRDGGRMFALLK